MPCAAAPRFVLTGPSGWIGRAMLSHIAARFGAVESARVTAFASTEREQELDCGGRLPVRALSSVTADDVAGAHVIHLAYLTKEKAEELGERVFTDGNLAIDDALLSAIESGRPASLFVASSGAAALAARGVDLHPYGVAKLRQEARFLQWGARAGVPVIAGRIFNIAGPYINKLAAYAVSDLVLQARDKGEIAIKAAIPVFRSFLHVDDLCALVVAAGLKGIGRDRPIDLCGAEVVEMADLAALVAARCGNVSIRRGSVDFTRVSAYLGDFTDTRVLAMELGQRILPLSAQIDDTIHWLSDGLNFHKRPLHHAP